MPREGEHEYCAAWGLLPSCGQLAGWRPRRLWVIGETPVRWSPLWGSATYLLFLPCPAWPPAANELDLALDVYRQMLNEGCTPNLVTCVPAPPAAAAGLTRLL